VGRGGVLAVYEVVLLARVEERRFSAASDGYWQGLSPGGRSCGYATPTTRAKAHFHS